MTLVFCFFFPLSLSPSLVSFLLLFLFFFGTPLSSLSSCIYIYFGLFIYKNLFLYISSQIYCILLCNVSLLPSKFNSLVASLSFLLFFFFFCLGAFLFCFGVLFWTPSLFFPSTKIQEILSLAFLYGIKKETPKNTYTKQNKKPKKAQNKKTKETEPRQHWISDTKVLKGKSDMLYINIPIY